MSTQPLNINQLVGTQHFQKHEDALTTALSDLRTAIAAINIFRPLDAYRRLRSVSAGLDALKPQLDSWQKATADAIGKIDVTTMGQVVTAPPVMIYLQMRLMEKQQEFNDIGNQVNTIKAFAFGVFALYVSLISLAATVVLGVLPLLQ